MQMRSLKESFNEFCEQKNFEKNKYQLIVLDLLVNFFDPKYPAIPHINFLFF